MKEDQFVLEAMAAAEEVLKSPLVVRRGVALLYQITINNRLELTIDPKKPVRGQSAFQTDLCVFEGIAPNLEIPRVVMEFKDAISTHDVLTYSAKARKHKQVYPYLRYGIVIGKETHVPGRVFTHNEALDFCVAAASFKQKRLHEIIATLLREEIAASRRLEDIFFGKVSAHIFRNEVRLEEGGGRVG
ncbi:MAG: hypothetical protein EXS64_00290 [Candidatus Latescibacteria bacterium]|nr:hypothetical protein [Candidatus Latescibacterota bacterium]